MNNYCVTQEFVTIQLANSLKKVSKMTISPRLSQLPRLLQVRKSLYPQWYILSKEVSSHTVQHMKHSFSYDTINPRVIYLNSILRNHLHHIYIHHFSTIANESFKLIPFSYICKSTGINIMISRSHLTIQIL